MPSVNARASQRIAPAVLLCLFASLASCGSSTPPASELAPLCETHVRQELAFPASAKFLDEPQITRWQKKAWTAHGTVQAQNASIAGKTETTYACTAEAGPNGKWRVTEVSFGSPTVKKLVPVQ